MYIMTDERLEALDKLIDVGHGKINNLDSVAIQDGYVEGLSVEDLKYMIVCT